MIDFYKNTRKCIDDYNMIQEKIRTSAEETDDAEDEFMMNYSLYFAHALVKDAGNSKYAREELCRVADIINDICR